LATIVVLSAVKIILELFRPAFGVLPKTGDAKPVDRGKPGYERLRTICACSISAGYGKAVRFDYIDMASTPGGG